MSTIAIVFAALSLGLSAWAAWTSHETRKWQRARDLERQATKVRIEFGHASEWDTLPVAFLGDVVDPRPERQFYELSIYVINQSEHTEHLTWLYLQQPGEVDVEGIDVVDRHSDHVVAPRGRYTATLNATECGIDLTGGFEAFAHLASGEVVESGITRLDEDLVADIAAHNRTARP